MYYTRTDQRYSEANMDKLRLKYVTEADFRYGPWTLWKMWEAHRKQKRWLQLKAGEVALFVSKRGAQLLFFSATSELSDGRVVLDTHRLQLQGGTWNPLRIKEYAEKIGIDLQGLQGFEEHYKEAAERRAQRHS